MALTLENAYEFYDFIVNKYNGAWFPPEEKDLAFDYAQMSLFNDYYDDFGTSQKLNDSLAPFKKNFQFSNGTCPGGLITMPDDYQHFLSAYTIIFDNVRGVRNRPIPILSEDEIADRTDSQIIPNTIMNPFGNIVTGWDVQLYPQIPQAGNVFYLRRPVAPKFEYTVTSGRVIVYDPLTSTQLEWAEKDQLSIIIKALNFAGINISEADIVAWSQNKDSLNVENKESL